MSIETEARQESERRWPVSGDWNNEAADIGWNRQHGFIDGAVWAREQDTREPSAAEVEAGCVAFYEGAQGITSWERMKVVEPDLANRYRDGIRAALLAAQEVRNRD